MIPNIVYRVPIPKELPKDMQKVVNELKRTKSKQACLKKAYDVLTKKFVGYHLRTLLRLNELWWTDINRIWNRNGFQLCNNMNFALRVVLIKSGKFTESDIKFRGSMIWFISPHQYVQVRVSKSKWVNIDIWGATNNVPFGKYAHGFR